MASDPTTPKLDARSVDDLAAETEALLAALTGGAWTPQDPARGLDPLGALVRVFADMAGQLVDGINAVPDAGFSAFLKLIGAEPQRPAPARVPLTFRLAEGAPADATIPAGTRVGASAAEGDTDPEPIVFETDGELVVTRARLLSVHAHHPEDRLDTLGSAPIAAFNAQTLAVHELLIACPDILARPGAAVWTLSLEFDAVPDLELSFHADDPIDGPRTLAASVRRDNKTIIVTLDRPPALRATTLAGREDAWLIVRRVPRAVAPAAPPLRKVSLAATYSGAGIAPGKILRGAAQLDVVTDFYPFDTVPALGSTLAVDAGEALAQPAGTSVDLTVTLAAAVASEATRPKASADLRLAWELQSADGTWIELGRSSGTDPAILADPGNPHGFVDDTYALTRSGRVRFKLRFTPDEQKLSGQSGRWLRARIVQGNYGAGATLRPPIVGTAALGYNHALAAVPSAMCVGRDLGHLRDLGPVTGAAPVAIFTPAPPGAPALGDRPALYLAFDRPWEPRPVHVWFSVAAPDPAQISPPDQLPPTGDEPRVVWEYLGPAGWTRLGVRDDTQGLRQRGLLRFVAPVDPVVASLFGRAGVWVRARWQSGSFRVPPRVSAVVPNTVWAAHTATRRNEVLGSGTGAPGQVLQLVAAPVLAGERIEVRELSMPSERDVDALRDSLGEDAVTVERDEHGELTAAWIRWTSVAHLRGSGPADRHYVLDADTGELRFGDGLAGLPPPQGRSNIRAAVYATGGGPRGNRPTGAVAELKAAIAYVAEVSNPEPATGGTAREDLARTRARGPRRLRHRGRAVTTDDLEDLAFEAAPEVARAHALTIPFNPIDVGIDLESAGRDARGWVTVGSVPEDTSQIAARAAEVRLVIVPHDTSDRPAPSIGLLEHVEAYLRGRAAAAMRLHVSGPRWIRVTVQATVVAAPGASADRLLADLRAAITRFLHPLTGGEHGTGWDFGRIPRRSHLYRLLARFPGVDHLPSLAVVTDPPLPDASEPLSEQQRRALAGALVYSGAHELVLVAPSD